jgi:hypothetical protein
MEKASYYYVQFVHILYFWQIIHFVSFIDKPSGVPLTEKTPNAPPSGILPTEGFHVTPGFSDNDRYQAGLTTNDLPHHSLRIAQTIDKI